MNVIMKSKLSPTS